MLSLRSYKPFLGPTFLVIWCAWTALPSPAPAVERAPETLESPPTLVITGSCSVVEGADWTGCVWMLQDPNNRIEWEDWKGGMPMRFSVRDSATGDWGEPDFVPLALHKKWGLESYDTSFAGGMWYVVGASQGLTYPPLRKSYDAVFSKCAAPDFTWTDPSVILSGVEGDSVAMWPDIAADSFGHIYIVYEDSVSEPNDLLLMDVYLVSSADHGDTWTAPVMINTSGVGSTSSCQPQVCCDDAGNVFVVWAEYADGQSDVLMRCSADFGQTWDVPMRVPTPDPATSSASSPQVVPDGSGGAVVAWVDMRDGCSVVGGRFVPGPADVYARVYTPGPGKGTWSAEARLDTDAPGASRSGKLALATDGAGAIAAAWLDNRNGPYTVYCNRSLDGGSSWLPADVRVDNAPEGVCCTAPKVAMNGGVLACAWSDSREGRSCSYVSYSFDNGLAWQGADVKADADGSLDGSWNPAVGVSADGSIDVAWANALWDDAQNYDFDYVTRATHLDTHEESAPLPDGWALLSVPIIPNSWDARFVFHNALASGHELYGRLHMFDPALGYTMYSDFTAMDASHGYWLLADGGAVSVTGSLRTDDQAVNLAEGWNLIGFGFTSPVAWGDCVVSDGVDDHPMSDPAAWALVHSVAYAYDVGGYIEISAADPTDVLNPWEGVWVLAKTSGLQLTVPAP